MVEKKKREAMRMAYSPLSALVSNLLIIKVQRKFNIAIAILPMVAIAESTASLLFLNLLINLIIFSANGQRVADSIQYPASCTQ